MTLSVNDTLPKIVYRGLQLSTDDVSELKRNIGKLISPNGFMSTSRSRRVANFFAGVSDKYVKPHPVVYEIECNHQLARKFAFTDISVESNFPEEQEVLFDIGCTFKIVWVKRSKPKGYLVRLRMTDEGSQMADNYMESKRSLIDTQDIQITFGSLLRKIGHYDKSCRYFKQLLADSAQCDIAWIHYHLALSLTKTDENEEALKHLETAANYMKTDAKYCPVDLLPVLCAISNIQRTQGLRERTSETYRIAMALHNTCTIIDSNGSGLSYIADIYFDSADYDRARQICESSLQLITQSKYPDYLAMADILNTLGNISLLEGNSTNNALEHFRKCLSIRESWLPGNHPAIADVLEDLATAYSRQYDTKQEIKCLLRAVKVRQQHLPYGKISLAHCLHRASDAYEKQGKLKLAVSYMHEVLQITDSCAHIKPITTAQYLFNLAELYRKLHHEKESVVYYHKSVKISQLQTDLSGEPDRQSLVCFSQLTNYYAKRKQYDQAYEYCMDHRSYLLKFPSHNRWQLIKIESILTKLKYLIQKQIKHTSPHSDTYEINRSIHPLTYFSTAKSRRYRSPRIPVPANTNAYTPMGTWKSSQSHHKSPLTYFGPVHSQRYSGIPRRT
ncbi:unnamed protein product [Adineta ricciae]|uniref:Uncharacterized protein n=1 Tax=Adineta ricciae TaxID=249248 RepID=A0A814S000_ADIRI|nr:unnamed protein product [Adineta ricciae]